MAEEWQEEREDAELWQTRATAWELAALSFRYPDAMFADVVESGEWVEAAREVAGALGFALPEGFGDGIAEFGDGAVSEASAADCAGAAADADSSGLLHALRAESTHLFIGTPAPACSPYEGVWRAKDEGVEAMLFVNPHTKDVERFCKACGLGQPAGTNEPLDYVVSECELLEHLSLRAAGVQGGEGLPAVEDLPGGSPQAAYTQFMDEHVQTWMPRFADSVVEKSRMPFFRAAGQYLGTLTNVEFAGAAPVCAAAEGEN